MFHWVAVFLRAEHLGDEPESDFPQIPQVVGHVAPKELLLLILSWQCAWSLFFFSALGASHAWSSCGSRN